MLKRRLAQVKTTKNLCDRRPESDMNRLARRTRRRICDRSSTESDNIWTRLYRRICNSRAQVARTPPSLCALDSILFSFPLHCSAFGFLNRIAFETAATFCASALKAACTALLASREMIRHCCPPSCAIFAACAMSILTQRVSLLRAVIYVFTNQ
jgi:hypothetical protein